MEWPAEKLEFPLLVPQGIELRNFGSLVLFPYQYTSSKSISNGSRLYMEEDWEGTLEIELDLGRVKTRRDGPESQN